VTPKWLEAALALHPVVDAERIIEAIGHAIPLEHLTDPRFLSLPEYFDEDVAGTLALVDPDVGPWLATCWHLEARLVRGDFDSDDAALRTAVRFVMAGAHRQFPALDATAAASLVLAWFARALAVRRGGGLTTSHPHLRGLEPNQRALAIRPAGEA
jgi:hypothetical protein